MKRLLSFIALLLINSAVMAQNRQITGNVKDSKTAGNLSAATVKVKGQNTSTVTGADGNFTLTVPAGIASLEVSSIGYGTKTVTVGESETNVSISLNQAAADLSEVVVTALGFR